MCLKLTVGVTKMSLFKFEGWCKKGEIFVNVTDGVTISQSHRVVSVRRTRSWNVCENGKVCVCE